MNDLDSRDSTSRNYNKVGIRPPVIGQENTSSSSEDANSCTDSSILMQSNPNTRPPTLPPKPRIGSGVPLIRGPPPPVQPRSSSLQANHQNSASGSQEFCSDETDQCSAQPSALLASEENLVAPSSHEAVMVASTLKCDTKTFEDNLSSPQPGKSLGSESSRGFEPEGSVDMSPSYSESGGSGTNNGHGTPPFVKWREGISYLIDDPEGCVLFNTYLEEQELGHYFKFLAVCRGIKNNMALGDPEGNVLASIDAVCKRFINPTKRKFMSFRIDCLDAETKNFIESKLKNLDSQNIDQNIFDGAVNLVMNHLSTKFYPNFLTSDIFVNYVRAYQQQNEPDSHISAASSISGSRPQRDLQEDSGMEEDKGGFSSSKSSTVPVLTMSDSLGVVASDPLRLSSASTTTCNSSVFNSSSFLPTVEEERELRLDPSTATPSKVPQTSQSLIVNPPHGIASASSSSATKMDSLSTLSHPPPAMSSRTARMKGNELHPNVFGPTAGSTSVPDIRSASYAYHANSSNWNPVSRQDSELQSQSSGAVGGDTTDDNYSTFTDVQQQQQQQQHLTKLQHHHLTQQQQQQQYEAAKKIRDKKHDRRSHQKEFQKIEKASQLIREDPNTLLPRSHFDNQAFKTNSGQPNPEKNINEFADLLISKLSAVKKEVEGKLMLTHKLNQVGDGDSSVASLGPYSAADQHKKRYQQQLAVFGSRSQGDPLDAESDQSILDDHVSRIFNLGGTDTPPSTSAYHGGGQRVANVSANTTSMFDTSRRSMNTTAMSGHSTLPGRSRTSGYPQYGHNMSSSTISQHQYHPQQYSRTGQYHAGSSNSISGDIGPVRTSSGTSRSLVDMSGSVSGFQQPHQNIPRPPPHSSGQPLNKVSNWLVGQQQQGQQYPQSSGGASLAPGGHHAVTASSDHSMSKTSPRSSGRYHTSSRAKSQDRSSSAYPPMYQLSQSFNSGQYSQVDPSYLASRLQQQQQQQQQHQHRAASSRSMMSTSASVLSGGSSSMPKATGDITIVVYRFPQEKESTPYRVKIPKLNLTLSDIRGSMPKKGNNFRFYFKTLVDGEACFEEETSDDVLVPMWEGSVVVQCRND